jgi:hypothetical protein
MSFIEQQSIAVDEGAGKAAAGWAHCLTWLGNPCLLPARKSPENQ